MLKDRKILNWTQPVTSLDDKPKLTAAALKAAFDSNTNEVKPALNGMIDDLTGTGGAGNVGTSPIDGVTGTDVQTMLAFLKGLIDLCDPTENVDQKLALKADKVITDKHIKTVGFNGKTGVFTFTREDGTSQTLDTMLEKVPVRCYLDGQAFVLVLEDGTEQRADLSAFLTKTEFTDSGTIDFAVSGETVTASVKAGSITLAMLESTVMSTLQGYMTAAQTSAGNAKTSEINAAAHKDAAAKSASASAQSASESAGHAKNAQSWAVGGTGTRPGEDTDNAKFYAKQAGVSADDAAQQMTAASTSAAEARESAAGAERSASGAGASASAAKLSETNAANSATAAEKSRQAVEDMTVKAQTLSPGAQATVSKRTVGGAVELTYGIPKGEKGDTGMGLTVLGYYASLSELQSKVPAPSVGHAYGIGAAAPYDIYIWDGKAWVNNGKLQGAKGDKGENGAPGATGSDGAPGKDGGYYKPAVSANGDLSWTASGSGMPAVGTVNIKGPKGADGAPGAAGTPGKDGAPGANGKDATINGVNALTLNATGGLKGTQSGATYTLDGSGLRPKYAKVTLTAAGWDSSAKTQKVTVNGVLADETKQLIMPMPAMASQNDYAAAGIACTLQEANALTFKCQTVPTADIAVFVTVQEVAG